MKLIDLTCNKCGAQLKANADLKKCSCNYCGNEMLIDDEVIHHQIDNAFDAGYQAEIGRQKALSEQLLTQARNAIKLREFRTASSLYKDILIGEPDNKEAIFFEALSSYMVSIPLPNALQKDILRTTVDKINSIVRSEKNQDSFADTIEYFSTILEAIVEIYKIRLKEAIEGEIWFTGDMIYRIAILILNYRDICNLEEKQKINNLVGNIIGELNLRPKRFSKAVIMAELQSNEIQYTNTKIEITKDNNISNTTKQQNSIETACLVSMLSGFIIILGGAFKLGFILFIGIIVYAYSILKIIHSKRKTALQTIIYVGTIINASVVGMLLLYAITELRVA